MTPKEIRAWDRFIRRWQSNTPALTDRPRQTSCQIEPSYPDHNTMLWSFILPDLVGHLPTLRCCTQEPHNIEDCKEFDRDE